jgi:hypothetical protein
MFGQARVNPAIYFCGGENFLSFITAYAPQGSMLQGMLRVTYQYDPGQRMLFIYQQSLTRLEDLDVAASGFGSKNAEEGLLVSQIQGISDFRLVYTGESLYDPDDPGQWQNIWDCGAESDGVPFGLMLQMTIGEGVRSRDYRWLYRVGDQQSQSFLGAQQPQRPSGGRRPQRSPGERRPQRPSGGRQPQGSFGGRR